MFGIMDEKLILEIRRTNFDPRLQDICTQLEKTNVGGNFDYFTNIMGMPAICGRYNFEELIVLETVGQKEIMNCPYQFSILKNGIDCSNHFIVFNDGLRVRYIG